MDFIINEDCIYFNEYFNKPLTYELLKIIKQFKKINFGIHFNQSIDNIPDNIEEISFGRDTYWYYASSYFNQSIDNLPCSLHTLILGSNFNQPIDNLPCSLKKLVLGSQFNQSIDNLPSSLEYLELGYYFNQPLYNLPQSVKTLSISKIIPIMANIDTLIIPRRLFDKEYDEIPYILRRNYKKLKQSKNNYIFEILDFLPKNIKKLGIYNDFQKKKIITLDIGNKN